MTWRPSKKTDNNKLKIIHAGATQVTGKKIMIFGGMVDYEIEEGDEHEKFTMNDTDRLL